MTTTPHVRHQSISLNDQLIDGVQLQDGAYTIFISADDFDTSATYWLKEGAGALQKLRLLDAVKRQLPDFAVAGINALDNLQIAHTDRVIYKGDDSGTAAALQNDTASSNRWQVRFFL